ncbi:MAG: hypothetical protein IT258_16450 [Saprospiraceae bacterium]|nr:hypothetical protein [Saprospiraceae bacterium]
MMKTRVLCFLIAALILPFSCKKNKCDGIYQAINKLVLEGVPYQDGDVVGFVTSEQDTFYATVERIFINEKPGSNLHCEEYLEVNFKEAGKTLNFMQFLQRGASELDSIVQLMISPLRNNMSNTVQIVFSKDGKTMTGLIAHGTTEFHSNIEINGVAYTDVLEMNWDPSFITTQDEIIRFLYNKQYGVLHYETKIGLKVDRLN